MNVFQMYWLCLKWTTAWLAAALTVSIALTIAYYVVRRVWQLFYWICANDEEAHIRRGKTTIIANFFRKFKKK